MITIDWKSLKKFIDTNGLIRFLNFLELDTSYYLWLTYQGASFSTSIDKGTTDSLDFQTNYIPNVVIKNDITSDGITFSRIMFVGNERFLHCLFVCFSTSTIQTNDETGFVTIKLKDAQQNYITDSTKAVYTEVDFTPGPSVVYGLYSGGIKSLEDCTSDITVCGIVAPDIPAAYGGQVYVVKNYLFDKPRENFSRHAIGVGDIPAPVPGANIFRTQVKHDQGIVVKFQLEIQYYI